MSECVTVVPVISRDLKVSAEFPVSIVAINEDESLLAKAHHSLFFGWDSEGAMTVAAGVQAFQGACVDLGPLECPPIARALALYDKGLSPLTNLKQGRSPFGPLMNFVTANDGYEPPGGFKEGFKALRAYTCFTLWNKWNDEGLNLTQRFESFCRHLSIDPAATYPGERLAEAVGRFRKFTKGELSLGVQERQPFNFAPFHNALHAYAEKLLSLRSTSASPVWSALARDAHIRMDTVKGNTLKPTSL